MLSNIQQSCVHQTSVVYRRDMAEIISECGGGHVWSKVETDASVAIKKGINDVPPSPSVAVAPETMTRWRLLTLRK